jgi:lipopolysaccharide/colanic/teichoic acid biosynthesis glycosyltransferase
MDLIIAICGMLILLPVLILIALLIRIFDGGPVLYRQERIGKDSQKFNLLKFRTMKINAEKSGPLITGKEDNRITKLGSFLRKYKLDELPQILNVIKGEISIVGPRPEVEKYIRLFADDYETVLTIRPGITDYGTIAFRNEEEILSKYNNIEEGYTKEVLPQKILLYRQYIQDRSFLTDVKIILKTLWKIIT